MNTNNNNYRHYDKDTHEEDIEIKDDISKKTEIPYDEDIEIKEAIYKKQEIHSDKDNQEENIVIKETVSKSIEVSWTRRDIWQRNA